MRRPLLGRRQQSIADAQASEALLEVQALQFSNIGRLDHRVFSTPLDLGETDKVAVGFGNEGISNRLLRRLI